MAYLVTSGTGTSATRHIVLADVDGSNTRTLAASWAFLGWSPDTTVLLEAAGPGAPSDPFPNGLLIVDPTGARSPIQIPAEELFGQSWQAIR